MLNFVRHLTLPIPDDVLFHKLLAVGVAGDLWSWIKDYLANRSLLTIVNEVKPDAVSDVSQGSVLGSILFSLFFLRSFRDRP